jgi:hypothetical protein
MSYCAETDIEAELQKDFTANTELTSTQVTSILTRVDDLIDSELSGKYITPITGTKALNRIKDIAILIGSGRIEQIYGFDARYITDEITKERVPARLGEGLKQLRRLVKGESTLIFETAADSAVLKVSNQKVSSSADDGVTHADATDFGTNFEEDKY